MEQDMTLWRNNSSLVGRHEMSLCILFALILFAGKPVVRAALIDQAPAAKAGSQAALPGVANDYILADDQPGIDIGARINASKELLPRDSYGIPTGVIKLAGAHHAIYYFATPIQLDTLNATIDCAGATLVWTGANAAAAVVLAGPLRKEPNGAHALVAVGSANGGIENCNLQTLQTYPDATRRNTPADATFVPSIQSISIDAGGRGYTAGDVVQVIQVGGSLGTAIATNVNGGVVSSLSLLHGGYGYTAGVGLSTSGGSGTGLTVSIISNPPVSCYPYNKSPKLPTAIVVGGDPTGTIPGDPATNYGNNQYLRHVHISGFCGAFVPGNNMWQNQFDGVIFDHNYWDVDDEYSPLIANTGERSTFINSRLDGAAGAAIRNDGGSQFTLGSGTSLDYNERLNAKGQWVGGAPIVGSFMQLDFESAHIEDMCGPVIVETGKYRGYVNITDGDIRLASRTPCSTAYFGIAGVNGALSASHVLFNAMHTVPFYASNPTNGAILSISDPVSGPEGRLPAHFSTNGTRAQTNFGSTNAFSPTNPGFIWNSAAVSSATVAAFEVPELSSGKGPADTSSYADLAVGRNWANFNNVKLRFYDAGGEGFNFGALTMTGETVPDLEFGNGTVRVPGILTAGSQTGVGRAAFAAGSAAGASSTIGCVDGHECDSVSGTLALSTGRNPTVGPVAKVSFGVVRTKLANCVVSTIGPVGMVTAISWSESARDVTLAASSPLLASTKYLVTYWCGGR
jgi:hypothetical protein